MFHIVLMSAMFFLNLWSRHTSTLSSIKIQVVIFINKIQFVTSTPKKKSFVHFFEVTLKEFWYFLVALKKIWSFWSNFPGAKYLILFLCICENNLFALIGLLYRIKYCFCIKANTLSTVNPMKRCWVLIALHLLRFSISVGDSPLVYHHYADMEHPK